MIRYKIIRWPTFETIYVHTVPIHFSGYNGWNVRLPLRWYVYILLKYFSSRTLLTYFTELKRERERLTKIGTHCSVSFDFFSVSKIFANTTDSVMTIKTSYVRFKSSWWRNFYRCLSLQIHGIDSSLHSIVHVILNSVKSSIIFLTNPN